MVSAALLQIDYRSEFSEDDALAIAFRRELGLAADGSDRSSASAARSATVHIYGDLLERNGPLQSPLSGAGVAAREINPAKESLEDMVLVVDTRLTTH